MGDFNCGGAPVGVGDFAEFYGLTAGTGNGGASDYAATIAPGAPVPYPRLGPTGGVNPPTQAGPTSFNLPGPGIGGHYTYEVEFGLHTTEPGQLQLSLNAASLPETTAANMNPTAGGHPIGKKVYIEVTQLNSVLEVINPVGNATALTVTPADGSDTHANAQVLTIRRIA